MSVFHFGSSLGDEESIDKNSANTIRIPAIAAANIEKVHLLRIGVCNFRANERGLPSGVRSSVSGPPASRCPLVGNALPLESLALGVSLRLLHDAKELTKTSDHRDFGRPDGEQAAENRVLCNSSQDC